MDEFFDTLVETLGINLRSAVIETLDGINIIVPNQDLITGQAVNGSKGSPCLRAQIPVGVSYRSVMKKAFEVPFPQRDLHIRTSDVPLTTTPTPQREAI